MICRDPKCAAELPEGANFCPRCGKKAQLSPRKTKSRGNGLGSVYKLPNGKYCAEKTLGYVADPLPPDAPPGTKPHKRRIKVTRQFDRKKDAMEALPGLGFADRRPREGTATARKGKRVTLQELYEQWFPTHGKSRSTMNCYKSGFRLFEELWAVPMEDLDIDDLQACLDDSDAGRRTQENARAALGLVYKYGIPRNAIPHDRNLASFLRLSASGSASRKTGFTVDELEKIRKAADAGDPEAMRVLCHCYLGFRPTALLQLQVRDYDPERRAFVGGIKTPAGKGRTVPVSPKIQPWITQLAAGDPDRFVFGKDGAQESLADYRASFYELLQRVGIDNPTDEQGRHRVTPHSCRHTFATMMKRVPGADADKLALIGHTSTEQLRDYQDVPIDDLRRIIDAL